MADRQPTALEPATHWSRPMLAGPQNGSQRAQFGAEGAKRRKRPLRHPHSAMTHDAAEQRAALRAFQASRSCSLAGAACGATTTVPSNTSGPRNAFISLSCER